MTTIEIVDFMKLLKAGDNKRTIEYVDKLLNKEREDGYNKGWIDGRDDLWDRPY